MKKNEAWRVWDVDKLDQTELENFPVSRIDWERVSNLHVKYYIIPFLFDV
jgi:hypothetical protein